MSCPLLRFAIAAPTVCWIIPEVLHHTLLMQSRFWRFVVHSIKKSAKSTR
jgi:hypothetical protein